MILTRKACDQMLTNYGWTYTSTFKVSLFVFSPSGIFLLLVSNLQVHTYIS